MIEIDNSIISSEMLLERVRKNILNKNIKQEYPPNTLLSENIAVNSLNLDLLNKELNSLRENVRTLDNTWIINDMPLNTTKKTLSSVNIFIKKVIRRLCYWVIIRPYWNQQIAFNGAATRAISDIMKVQEMIVNAAATNKED